MDSALCGSQLCRSCGSGETSRVRRCTRECGSIGCTRPSARTRRPAAASTTSGANHRRAPDGPRRCGPNVGSSRRESVHRRRATAPSPLIARRHSRRRENRETDRPRHALCNPGGDRRVATRRIQRPAHRLRKPKSSRPRFGTGTFALLSCGARFDHCRDRPRRLETGE